VAEDFLNDADVYALLDEECSRCVASVVKAAVTNARRLE
jgi:hypothetical protein